MNTSHELLLKPDRGHSLSVVGDILTFKAVGEDTNGQYTLIELRVDPEIGPPPHIHHREDGVSTKTEIITQPYFKIRSG